MNAMEGTNDTENNGAITLEQATSCQLGGVDETWVVDELDCADELKDAIQSVQDDHDEERLVVTDTVWILKVHWNDNTEEVWVGTFGYNGGYKVEE